jgi:hypothetical protein
MVVRYTLDAVEVEDVHHAAVTHMSRAQWFFINLPIPRAQTLLSVGSLSAVWMMVYVTAAVINVSWY